LALGISCPRQYPGNETEINVSREKLKEWMNQKSDVLILDVRSKKEYESGHVPNAMNIDYMELSSRLDELKPYKDHKIVVYCRSGRRTRIAQDTLKKAGFSKVYHLSGDIIGWKEAGWPTEPGD
jgi:rhodanese-related sulfurtransferase